MKLWEKEKLGTDKEVEKFTVGRDKEFDLLLAGHDVIGSIAHAKMLCSVGLLSGEELKQAVPALENILKEIEKGKFKIEEGIEDVHSQVELLLTQAIGDTGKKIHSGRSRNDQSLLAIKLYLKNELKEIGAESNKLFSLLISLSEKHKEDLLPGYTHLQLAMPSSFGLWFGAYAESLTDDMELVLAAHRIADKNPLGSAAGYGSSFPIDRKMTTGLLGFSDMNYNSVYAQMTRGKTEKAVAVAAAGIASTLSKLAYDACLYVGQDLGFISFPPELTTGSSIMPHKKNPDVLELIRAKCNRIQALPNELTLLTNNLPSGYHRDLQLTKEVLFPGIQELKDCLRLMRLMLDRIEVKKGLLKDEKYKYLFSVEAVNKEVIKGMPFREAYKKVAKEIGEGSFKNPGLSTHTHEGSIGNLCNEGIVARMTRLYSSLLN